MILVKNSTSGEWEQVAGNFIGNANAPIGAIFPFGGSSAPSGYLMCDGSAVSRTDYSALFAVIGTSFGAGDGSKTFNVPDLREATTKGVGLSGKSSNHYDSDGVALGEFVEDRIKSHTHSMNHTHTFSGTTGAMNSNASHTHTTNGFESISVAKSGFGYAGYLNGTGTQTTNATDTNHTHNYSGTTSSASTSTTGSTGSVTTEVKAVGVNYIIKAKDVNLSGGTQTLADRVSALETYGKKILWTGTATKGDTIAQFSVQGYDEVIAQVGGTWIRLDSGHGVGANGRKKFTGLYAGRDTAGGAPYEQYYLLDILGTGYIADCAWFDVGSMNVQNARLAGQKAIECITNAVPWSDPVWKNLKDVETNVDVTRIIGVKYPLIA